MSDQVEQPNPDRSTDLAVPETTVELGQKDQCKHTELWFKARPTRARPRREVTVGHAQKPTKGGVQEAS